MIERVAGLEIPEATVNSVFFDEVNGDRTVDDPQDLAQHLGLGSEQEGQRLGKVSCFGRTGSTRCTVLSTIRYE